MKWLDRMEDIRERNGILSSEYRPCVSLDGVHFVNYLVHMDGSFGSRFEINVFEDSSLQFVDDVIFNLRDCGIFLKDTDNVYRKERARTSTLLSYSPISEKLVRELVEYAEMAEEVRLGEIMASYYQDERDIPCKSYNSGEYA